MVSRYRHRRTSNPATAFPALVEPGEIVANTSNRQLAIGDADSGGTIGTPLVLLVVRAFDARAQYATGDFVVQAGALYRAKAAITPGAFNAANWEKYDDTTTLKAYIDAADATLTTGVNGKVAKAGDTMTGHLTLPVTPAAANAVRKDYVDTADALKADKTYVDTQDALKADKTYVDTQDALKAPLASPTFTGDPQAPTAASTDNDTSVATTAFVKAVLAAGTYTTAIADGAVSTAAKLADGIVTFAKMATAAIATVGEYLNNTANKILTADRVWAAAGTNPTVTDAASVALDFSLGINFYWAVGAAGRTLANPTNQKPGQSGVIRLGIVGAGSSVTGWGTAWKFSGGVKPTTSVAAGSIDMLTYYVAGIDQIYCSFLPDMK